MSSLEQLRHRTMSLSFLPMGMKFFSFFWYKNTICVLGWVVVPHDDSCRLMLGKIDSHRKGLDIQISRMLIVDTELKWHAAVNQRELVHGMAVVSGLPSHVTGTEKERLRTDVHSWPTSCTHTHTHTHTHTYTCIHAQIQEKKIVCK